MITFKKRTKKKLAFWCYSLGLFFLPFGYDAIFKFIMDWSKSYWVADVVFYSISSSLFIGYFIFSEKNPIKEFMKWYKRNLRKAKKLKTKFPWLFKKGKKKSSVLPSKISGNIN